MALFTKRVPYSSKQQQPVFANLQARQQLPDVVVKACGQATSSDLKR